MIKVFKKKDPIKNAKPAWEYNGHKYYVLNPYETDENSPVKLSNQRALDFALAMLNLKLSIEKGDLNKVIDKIVEHAMNKENSQIVFICELLKARIELKTDSELVVNLGYHTVLIDDEPNELPTSKHNNIKNELLKDPAVRGFFLRRGLQWMKNIDPSLNITQTEDYLKCEEAQEINQILQSWI
jgi:hypothetical protein